MEDFPKEDNEEKKTGRKKRRSGDFFMDKVRFLLDQSRSRETEEEQGEETGKKRPFARKWWKKIFGQVITPPSLITKELIPEPEQPAQEALKRPEEYEIPQDKPHSHLELSETPLENTSVSVEHTPVHEEDELMGELVVSHESEDYELEQDLPEPTPEIVGLEASDMSLAEFQQVIQQEAADGSENTSLPPEHIGNIVKRLEQRDETVFKRNEKLSRRRDKKLKLEAIDLKKRVKEAEKEQKTLKQEQQEFRQQVAHELQRPTYERLAAKQEQQRRRLQENRGINLSPAPEGASVLERHAQSRSEQLKEFVATTERDRPEAVQRKVEKAAEKDMPIESAYERRHEIKDEDKPGGITYSKSRSSSGRPYVPVTMPLVPASYAEQHPQDLMNTANLLQSIQQQGIYKDAVKGGFWTAIALLVIMFVIYVAR